jgi:hypothetical protein
MHAFGSVRREQRTSSLSKEVSSWRFSEEPVVCQRVRLGGYAASLAHAIGGKNANKAPPSEQNSLNYGGRPLSGDCIDCNV